MARHKVVHSSDGCTILIEGDKRRPEPSTAVIKFPGGHVEVSRTSEGNYWVHTQVYDAANIIDSRVDYNYEQWKASGGSIPAIPGQGAIQKIAILVKEKEDG